MNSDLDYPKMSAAEHIFRKLGIDPKTRFHADDQDFEYTSCRMEELRLYFDLYMKKDTSDLEKRVLGCFFLEGLNDFVSLNSKKHPLQDQILEMLHKDIGIHKTELDYRAVTDDPNEEHWWPVRKYILEWQRT